MNMPQLESDLANIRRKELEDWAKRERLARAATRTAPTKPSLLSKWIMRLSKIVVRPVKRTRKMHKTIPSVR